MSLKKTHKKTNILYCIDSLAHGGTEKQLMTLIDKINGEEFKSHLCCIQNKKNAESKELFAATKCNKIQLDFTSFRKIKVIFEIIRFIKYIKQNKIDIIQVFFQDPMILGVIGGKLLRVRHIIACFRDMTFWYEYESKNKLKLLKLFYGLCSNYIANSNAVKNKYVELFNLDRRKCDVIYNGIDLDRFSQLARSERHKTNTSFCVGIVANFNRKVKRVDVFIKAAAEVCKKEKNITFVVIGDGDLKNELIALSRRLGIEEKISFTGRVADVPRYLSKLDMGVITSDSEGFSNSILEYMASGLPVIATDVGGNNEIIINNFNGFLVSKGDYIDICERILQLYNDKITYKEIQKNALESVSNYTLGKYVKEHEIYYKNLLT